MEKLAICGGYGKQQLLTEYLPEDWEIWGLNDAYIPRFDRWFEMHTMRNIKNRPASPHHYKWLKNCDKPIYMKKHYKVLKSTTRHHNNYCFPWWLI